MVKETGLAFKANGKNVVEALKVSTLSSPLHRFVINTEYSFGI